MLNQSELEILARAMGDIAIEEEAADFCEWLEEHGYTVEAVDDRIVVAYNGEEITDAVWFNEMCAWDANRTMNLSQEAEDLISDLREDGFDYSQIRDFLEDGAAMKEYGLTDQEVVEEAWQFAKEHA